MVEEPKRTDELNVHEGDMGEEEAKPLYKNIVFIAVLAVLGLVIAFLLSTIGDNLQDAVDTWHTEGKIVQDEVGVAAYKKVLRDSQEIEEQQERDRILTNAAEADARNEKRVATQATSEPLKEGHMWHYNVLTEEYTQVLVNPEGERVEKTEDDIVKSEEAFESHFKDPSVTIAPPRDEVIVELARSIDRIIPEYVFLTKGQFIYWLQDNLLFLVGSNTVQTFWDPETFTVTVKTHYGDKEEVKALTEQRIKIAYERSSYGVLDGDKLVINYE